MKRTASISNFALAVLIAGVLAGGQAMADKPSWAGGGKGDKGGKSEHRDRDDDRKSRQRDGDDRSRGDSHGPARDGHAHFDDRHRAHAHEYYGEQFRRGRCPPGLAKKRNGCMPPGQARKWTIGRPLPREVIFYDVPPALVVQFGPPPPRHRYVRVAGDILLIALGTGMVADAIQDLGRM